MNFKNISFIFICIFLTSIIALVSLQYSHWQERKSEVTTQLSNELKNLGVTSSIEIRKSKLDADDWKYKIWFRVPDDKRIVDVFWCEDSFQFQVRKDGQHTTLPITEFRTFMESYNPDTNNGL